LDLISLASNIHLAVSQIDAGRKGWATKGKEAEGRVSYEEGIDLAMSTFKEAQTSVDPHALILAEYTFICQELQLCSETDNDSLSSLTQAKQNFDWKAGEPRQYNIFPYQRQTASNAVWHDAFMALQVVENSTFYKEADKTFPYHKNYRVRSSNGFPKDAFHFACGSHKARLKNTLRSPGIDLLEKALLKQRFANLATAQSGYMEKQKKALTN
jgi:hypothetical protein